MNQSHLAMQNWSVRLKVNLAIGLVFFAVIIVLAGYSYVDERQRNLDHAIEQVKGMNGFYFDSLNTLMLADGMEEREELRTKMLELPGITEARVTRAPSVTKKFGEGLPGQKSVDELDRRGLAGESIVEVGEHEGARMITIIEPYRITEDTRGTDCTECHRRIESGTVGGAIRLGYSLKHADDAILTSLLLKFGLLSLLFFVGMAALSILMHRMVRVPIAQALGFANAISTGDLDNDIKARSGDEVGQLIKALGTMQTNLKASFEKDRRTAAESLRIKLALDSSGSATTVSDANNQVIYFNPAAAKMFKLFESAWQQSQSDFRLDDLVGRRLGDLLTGSLRDAYRTQLTEPLVLEGEIGERQVRLHAGPVYDGDGNYQGRVTQWEDLTEELAQAARERERLEEERRIAAENQRIKVALDQVSANVMLVDPERNIVYANRATQDLLQNVESDFAEVLPGFDAQRVIGRPFNDALDRGTGIFSEEFPTRLASAHETEFEVGVRTLHLVANPVINDEQESLGTALEWRDRTEEVGVEREIDRLVEAARAGDLERRFDLTGKQGFFHQLGERFNKLMDELSNVFDDIGHVMEQLAGGDLRQTLDKAYQGRFSQVQSDINRTVGNIENTVSRLTGIASQVSQVAAELSGGNENLSSRTEQQAASIEETASSMQELTTTVSNNAENAKEADAASRVAREAAERGGQVVGEAVAAMQQINQSSERINEIIGVIDEIAFQTNLLALNASVEAARAGEQGRGFAVVASEVRNLASRSAEAAKEIKVLIEDSGDKVKAGSDLVHRTGEALDKIVVNVKQVGAIISEITKASSEQATGIEQVNRAIAHIDEITQQNAALAEETMASSGTMQENANDLAQAIGFFRTRNGG